MQAPFAPIPHRAAPCSRRQFLGYGTAGMLAVVLPGCHSDSDDNPPSPSNVDYSQTIEWGRKEIERALAGDRQNVAAVSIALLKNDTVVWQQAFGRASVQDNIAATTQTRFNIGSVSKVLAALAAMILRDRGLLDLDVPAARYLPGFSMLSPEYAQITTRHLLSHSSGLPGTSMRNAFTFEPLPGYAVNAEAALADQHLKHLPGMLAVYCNDGFTMIERLVAALAKQDYASFIQDNVLDPLGMSDSGFLTEWPEGGLFALPYSKGKQYAQEFVSPLATGGLTTTPGDMMKLAQLFLEQGTYQSRRIVSADGVAQMGTDQTTGLIINPSPQWVWGLGWDSVRHPGLAAAGVQAWQKNGGTAFFSSDFYVLPDQQLALMVTGGTGDAQLPDTYRAGALAEGVLLRALVEEGSISGLPPLVAYTAPPRATAPDLADAVGVYANYNQPIRVTANPDGSFSLSAWNGNAWQAMNGDASYSYRSDDWWWSNDAPISYRFEVVSGTDANGQAYQYRYLMLRGPLFGAGYNESTLPMGQQLLPQAPLNAVWQTRMGKTWTVINESPKTVPSTLSLDHTLYATLSGLPELPGYILVRNSSYDDGSPEYQLLAPIADDRAGMTVKIPANAGRDLYELHFTMAGDKEILTIGSWVYEPAIV
ncbi:beta-lactamase family protein [Pusillimonas sp. CC-YST705]|uniref:Beta-lactamase family protein n=1 Tax=Mesopusillimonas faecipullorum TaxID=2755040 RepID=A0ABS8C8N0_9BURK|nr:serine hydrolase domain-containing protein [Mesopusillimonas faecipullorum]MCB5362373.1 beta-lactamase family protein [Mesopusillimonas faecipullorum]